MAFNSLLFVFAIAPLFFLAYLTVPKQWRNFVCLAGSLAFYFWSEPLFCLLVIALSGIDHWTVHRIVKAETERERKALVAFTVTLGLLPLLYFKYSAFLYDTFVQITGYQSLAPGWLSPILPLAISFVTFEKITYVVDVYRGTGHPARRFADYLTYVFLFPKLVAGPIIKYHDIEPELYSREVTSTDFSMGLIRFAAGLAKKMLIADGLLPYAETTFAATPSALSASNAWLGLIAFSFQIYFDFSAYSDMAIGLSRMMGFRIKENFDQPYLAIGFSDFWRRWHISLSTWIRDYLFIPMGGSRVATWKIYRNLLVCFLLSGLWHGASMSFVVWGLYHGLFIIADRLGLSAFLKRFGTVPSIAATFVLVMFGWVFFRAETLAKAAGYFVALFSPSRPVPPIVFLDQNFTMLIAAATVLSFTPWRRVAAFAANGWNGNRLPGLTSWLVVAGFLWGCFRMSAVTFSPFLYFRF